MLNVFLFLLGAVFLTIAISGAVVVVAYAADTVKDIIDDWRE